MNYCSFLASSFCVLPESTSSVSQHLPWFSNSWLITLFPQSRNTSGLRNTSGMSWKNYVLKIMVLQWYSPEGNRMLCICLMYWKKHNNDHFHITLGHVIWFDNFWMFFKLHKFSNPNNLPEARSMWRKNTDKNILRDR